MVEAFDGRERGLEPRVATLALQRVQQAGLLAADVGAGPPVQDERQVHPGTEDVLTQVAGLGRLGDRRLKDVSLQLVLAADVDERAIDLARPAGDDDALD